MSKHNKIDRRSVLRLTGIGALATIAGCADSSDSGSGTTDGGDGGTAAGDGSSGDGSGGTPSGSADSEFMSAAMELGLTDNWRARRIDVREDWSMDARRDVPDRSNDTSWEGFESFETAPWEPPEGWEDTIAGEVDSIQIVNHGAANMEFDPATLATHELFEKKTGIEIEAVEIGVDQANLKEQQFLGSQKSQPQMFNVDGTLMPLLVQQGLLEVTDPLYSEDVFSGYVETLPQTVRWGIDSSREGTHTYGYPNILEGTVGNLRPDLVESQGIDPSRFEGEWTWDLLEETMQAFEGTDVFGHAYYAGTPTYLFISYRQHLYQQGANMVADDGTVRVDTEPSRRVLRKFREWRDKGWVPSDVITYTEGDLIDLFLSGKLAYANAFSDFVPRSLNEYEAGSEYQVVVPPAATAGPDPQQAGVTAPNATAVNPFADPAEKLVALIYGDLRLSYPSQWWEFTYEGNMTYMKQVYDDSSEADFVQFGDIIGDSIERGKIELFPQMQSIFQRIADPFQKAITGDLSPEEATTQAQTFIDSVLSQ